MAKLLTPFNGYLLFTIKGPGNLAVNGPGSVRVVTEVDGHQAAFLKGAAVMEGPEGGFQGLDTITGAADCWRVFSFEGAGGDFGNLRGKRVLPPVAGDGAVMVGQEGIFGFPTDGAADEAAEVTAGIDAGDSAVGRPGAFAGFFNRFFGIIGIEQGHGGQAHEGAVSGGMGACRSAEGIACLQEGGKGRPGRVADIEAGSCAAEVAFLPPTAVALHLVFRVESLAGDEAFGQAKGHGGVIGPLPRLQVEGATADHVGDGLEAPRQFELQRRSQGVSRCQAEEAAAISFDLLQGVISFYFPCCQ